MAQRLITIRLTPDQLTGLINRTCEPSCYPEHTVSDTIELLTRALDASPAGERLYSIEQICEVIRGTALAEGLPLGISLLDVRAGFKALDDKLDNANGAG